MQIFLESRFLSEPGSKLLVLGMVIQPLMGNPYNGYINPYYWVDDHPLLYGNNGSLDPSTSKFQTPDPEKDHTFGSPNYFEIDERIPNHKQVVEGLGYVPGVRWRFLRCL